MLSFYHAPFLSQLRAAAVDYKMNIKFSFGVAYAVVTCELKLFQNYFSLRRRPSEIILFHT